MDTYSLMLTGDSYYALYSNSIPVMKEESGLQLAEVWTPLHSSRRIAIVSVRLFLPSWKIGTQFRHQQINIKIWRPQSPKVAIEPCD